MPRSSNSLYLLFSFLIYKSKLCREGGIGQCGNIRERQFLFSKDIFSSGLLRMQVNLENCHQDTAVTSVTAQSQLPYPEQRCEAALAKASSYAERRWLPKCAPCQYPLHNLTSFFNLLVFPSLTL